MTVEKRGPASSTSVVGLRSHARRVIFRALHGFIYRLVVPCLSRTGRLEPHALALFRRLTSRPILTTDLPCPVTTSDGLALWWDPEQPSLTVRGVALGTYEEPVVRAFCDALRPGMSVLDLGAHIGYYTLLGARRVAPSGRVWSFEPDPANRALLERNVAENHVSDQVTVVGSAVGDTVGELELFRLGSDTGSATVSQRPGWTGSAVRVATTTIDVWAEAHGWPRIDMIKMDIEGAEVGALRGMEGLVARSPDLTLIVECQPEALEAFGDSGHSLFERLDELGFHHIDVVQPNRTSRLDGRSGIAAALREARWYPVNLICRQGPRRRTVGREVTSTAGAKNRDPAAV